MRAWEDFIDPLFKFCLHLKLCQIMIVAIMCVFKCFVREVNWMPIQNNARGIGNLEILDKCNFLKFLSNKIFLRLVEDLWLWFGGLKVGGRGGGWVWVVSQSWRESQSRNSRSKEPEPRLPQPLYAENLRLFPQFLETKFSSFISFQSRKVWMQRRTTMASWIKAILHHLRARCRHTFRKWKPLLDYFI